MGKNLVEHRKNYEHGWGTYQEHFVQNQAINNEQIKIEAHNKFFIYLENER